MAEKIVAYLQRGEWFKAAEVQKKRAADKGAFTDAHPYTISALRNRRASGRDVPDWIDLDKADETLEDQS